MDNELVSYMSDCDDDVKDILYSKYKYIIDVVIRKYRSSIYALNMDTNELEQEALVAFSDALHRFQDEKETSLPTFIRLCVDRKVLNCIRSARTSKNKIIQNTISLDYEYDDETTLENMIADNTYEPYAKIEDKESICELIDTIHSTLSEFEMEVYNLIIKGYDYNLIATILDKDPKQIDNTIQRIRNKLKDLKS